MKSKIQKYVSTWSFMRFLRLTLGAIILTQGFIAADTLSIILGGMFAGMALVNIGCSGSCAINSIGSKTKTEPELEKVVIKK